MKGKVKEYYDNGQLKYEGEYLNNKRKEFFEYPENNREFLDFELL